MTEKEALTKWCPMVRWSGGPGIKLTNREGKGGFGEAVTCIGADCMMWRREKIYITNQGGDHEELISTTNGYCGLGGKL